jgi:hypothetical protein
MSKMERLKIIKIYRFWGSKSDVIKWSKNDAKNDIFEGGVDGAKIIKNRPRGPGTPKTEFFEILQFSTKAPPLLTPKIDPYK